MSSNTYSREDIGPALHAAWPICLGYFPIGLALGVLAEQAGIPWWAMAMMSILVFAGSAQFICVAMLAAGSSIAAIIGATFIINFRHALMSSALALYLNNIRRSFLALFAYGITDESFAVNMARFRAGNWNRFQALIVNHLANSVWIIATVSGVLTGQFIPAGALGIDFALIGMFICLLVFQLHSRIHIITAIMAACIACTWALFVPGDSYIVGASMGAATGGFFLNRKRNT
ncbi:MAG: AzlC family ABC transporter permease [Pelovirga sp.]